MASSNGDIMRISSGKVLSQRYLREGYPALSLCSGGKAVTKNVCALVCAAFHGPKPSPLHEVAHWDGDRANSHYRNLRWATKAQNAADRRRHGTLYCGEKHWSNKLSTSQVGEIRGLIGTMKGKDIAARYGVHPSMISDIKKGKAWKR